jgi:uncharacterized protein (TIGR02147 family)
MDMNLFQKKSSNAYLSHYLSQLPKGGRGEISRISRLLGVSTTLVSQVLSGAKIFTPEQAEKLTPHFGLSGIEADYFLYLVQHDRAGTPSLKKFWKEKLDIIRSQSLDLSKRVATDRHLTEEQKSIFYSSYLYSAVRLLCSTSKNGKSLDDICIHFEITRAHAGAILRFLTETGLCNLKSNRYEMGLQKTHLERSSPHLPRHHANWRLRAIERSETLSEEELLYTAPVSLSRKDFQELREEMVAFIQKFLDKVHASSAEEVACFNMDFFWVGK